MNFAENQKWHPSLLWRAGPAKMLGGLMREGSDGRPEVGQPASGLGAGPANLFNVPYLADSHCVVAWTGLQAPVSLAGDS